MGPLQARIRNLLLLTVGGGSTGEDAAPGAGEKALGRVDLNTLGDALLAADVVLALRFPSRGEASGVLMRALAAGRAAVVSSGSSADEDLSEGVVARVNPGPGEVRELFGVLEFLLADDAARARLEQLASEAARRRPVAALTRKLADFVEEVAKERAALEAKIRARDLGTQGVRGRIRDDIDRAGQSLGLTHLPPGVFEKLAGL